MIKLTDRNGLSLVDGSRVIFNGIKPWICVDGTHERFYPQTVSVSDSEAVYELPEMGIKYSINLQNKDNVFALKINATYKPHLDTLVSFRNHFDPEQGCGFDIAEIGGMKRYMANFLNCEFWCRTFIGTDLTKMPIKVQGLMWESSGKNSYTYAVPVCDREYKSNLRGNPDGGFTLYAWSNTFMNHCETYAFFAAFGDDPYGLPYTVTGEALKRMGKKGRLRNERRFPELFEYLGWCSWDAFHMDVTHEDLLKKAKEFRDKDIPVKWFILDDMWGYVPNNKLKTKGSRELYSFEADPDRFPDGLKVCVTDLREQYGVLTGIWHPTNGYWNGIDPDGDIAHELSSCLVRSTNDRLVHSPDTDKAFTYYNAQHAFYRECGAEFVKVDNQGFIREHYKKLLPIGKAGAQLANAIEASVGANFDGTMINCMGMPSENFWNRVSSSVSRISGDFQPENRKWFIQHLLQCSYNSMIQGTVYYGDWDMWWSDDAQAPKNAVLRAMSGGPVYMSDELNRSIRETIMPIILKDGRILRCKNPAVPTPDCVFENAEVNGKIFKVFNRIDDAGVIAAFNLDSEEKPVAGTISASDMKLPDGNFCVYDFFGKTAHIFSADSSFDLSLKDYDDFRLYIFVPVKNGKAAVGLVEKYMAPCAMNEIGAHEYSLKEGGKFGFWSETPVDFIDVNGTKIPTVKEGLYTAMVPDSDEIIVKI